MRLLHWLLLLSLVDSLNAKTAKVIVQKETRDLRTNKRTRKVEEIYAGHPTGDKMALTISYRPVMM